MTLDRSIGPRCNIGPEEVARRRRSALFFTAVALGVAILIVASDLPSAARLILLPFAAGAAIAWLQVVHRFCVAFGAFGLENFGRLGSETRVGAEQRAADRRRALQLVLEGTLIGVIATWVFLILPV